MLRVWICPLLCVSTLALPLTATSQDWGSIATVSTTMGSNANRVCVGEASRGDIGCPTTAPYISDNGNVGIGTTTPANTLQVSGSISAVSASGAWLATQAEAEAGTDNTHIMTPLRVKQAIAANSAGGGIAVKTMSERNAMSPTAGTVIYNTYTNRLEWYNGTAWYSGGTPQMANYLPSCKAILDAGTSTGSGLYTIDPASNGTGFQAYCDMTNGGGGWTLVFDGGTGCGSTPTQKTSLAPNSCGYIPYANAAALASISSAVQLRAGASHTSYTSSTSVDPLARSAFATTNGTWHNGASTTFNNWSWTWSCSPSWATGYPNMFHACGNGNGVHWVAVSSYSFSGGTANEARTSGWFR